MSLCRMLIVKFTLFFNVLQCCYTIIDIFLVDEAVTICYNAIFANMGQCCCAGSRTFVHEQIYDSFVKKASEMASGRKVGNPFDDGVEQGPQVETKLAIVNLKHFSIQ